MKRVIWIVLDGVGAGALPDAKLYGDHASDTLGHVASHYKKLTGKNISLPNLEALGVGHLTPMEGVQRITRPLGAYGKAIEQSKGKDTTSGHWEMAGLIVTQPFTTYMNGFPEEAIDRWIKENNLPGILGNKAASGTDILLELGEEHVRTGKPILYTSADSVWQVAAHEESFGLKRLYSICESARKISNELQIGRVIARPFIGNPSKGIPFKRTYHRKDYAQKPFASTYLDFLCQKNIFTLGIGKISSIYCGQGIQSNIDTEGNEDGMRILNEQMDKTHEGLIFCNLIDFDMLYGHRRDVLGFGQSLESFDQALGTLLKKMKTTDLLLITADHGNDPTYPGTDHTREYIPILAYSPDFRTQTEPLALGIRDTFADLGATAVEALLGAEALTHTQGLPGRSFFSELPCSPLP